MHDESEKCLLREVENLRTNQKKLEACLDKCKDQVKCILICMIEFLIAKLQLNNSCYSICSYETAELRRIN